MKVLVLATMMVVAVGMVQSAALSPRDEAAELLLEVSQLDSQTEDDRDKRELDNTNKRSFGSGYGANAGYSANTGYGASAGYGAATAGAGYGAGYGYEQEQLAYPATKGAFDLWGFKRAILGALYQAVKAVAGGSIAVKGQVIKGTGNLIAAQGRLIASGGQSVSDFGRSIAHKSLTYQPAVPVVHQQLYAAPAPVATYSGYNNNYGHHNEGPGVIASLTKAKYAVGSAVGNAVGSAVNSAAGAVAGAVSGAANAVSSHVANKLNYGYAPEPAPVAYKQSSQKGVQAGLLVVNPISVAEPIVNTQASPIPVPVDSVASYGGSLDDSFGAGIGGGYNLYDDSIHVQPSISYDLH